LPLDYDVTFVGQAYGDRPHYIKELLDNGIDVHVWGPGWRKSADGVPEQKQGSIGHDLMDVARILATREGRKAAGDRVRRLLGRAPEPGRRLEGIPDKAVGGVLSDEEMIRLFSRSRINLGFSTCGNTGITGEKIRQVRLRDFEIPMSGGFYIAEYFEELEEFYEFGKEIVCFVSPEDLAEKIRYFLRHEGERERIRKAGFQRCRRDHSWHKRFIDAFAVMGLN
jgi:glycosyltransferase involved in cell wall biosynthesis